MKIAIIYAHPVRESLLDIMVKRLEANGHGWSLRPLCNGWTAALEMTFSIREPRARLDPMRDSEQAYEKGTQSPGIAAEQPWVDV